MPWDPLDKWPHEKRWIWLTIAAPDQRHRMVLVMHDQGFSINEIARNLGIDRKTVARKLDKVKQLYRNSKPSS